MSITIRKVELSDAEAVLRIMQLAFEEYRGRLTPGSGALTETIEVVRSALRDGGAFLAFVDEIPVGSARYRIFPTFAYAERISVLPEHRGKGIAGALMRAVEDMARAAGLPEVRVGVRAALPSNLRFYENLGYRAVESRPYPHGADVEITLGKPLSS